MLKKRTFWFVLILLLAGGGGGYAYYTQNSVAAQEIDEEPALQTSPVRRGDIVVSATGAGTVIAAEEVIVGFPTAGTLAELAVAVGDKVVIGDVLARLDDGDAQQAVVNAELQLTTAVMRTDGSATAAGVSFNDISIEQARINLAQAEATLEDLLNWEPDEDDIALAEASLASAEAGYSAALGSETASRSNVTVNSISLEQAERALTDAQAVYDTAFDPGRDWELNYRPTQSRIEQERESAASGLTRAQENLQIAQANYSATLSSQNSSSSTNAETNVLNAQLALAAVMMGPSDDEIEAVETAVLQAQLSWQQALLNQESDGINLTQAQLNLESAQAALADMVLVAPIDGTIMAVNGNAGELIGSGSLLTIADLSQPMVEIFIDETDLDKVGLGFEVEVVFDALPDDVFIGEIVQVDPQLMTVSGVSAIRAVVALNEDSFAKPQTLPVGLNATVEVIGGRTEGALLVPVEALREISPGQFALFILDGEEQEPTLRFVEVGLMDFTFAEIVSGVELGDVVSTGLIDTE